MLRPTAHQPQGPLHLGVALRELSNLAGAEESGETGAYAPPSWAGTFRMSAPEGQCSADLTPDTCLGPVSPPRSLQLSAGALSRRTWGQVQL